MSDLAPGVLRDTVPVSYDRLYREGRGKCKVAPPADDKKQSKVSDIIIVGGSAELPKSVIDELAAGPGSAEK